MTRLDFNRSWSYRSRLTAFQELAGAAGDEWTDVTLPHDAIISTLRRPDVERGEASGYFAGGSFEYRKRFLVPDEARGDQMFLEFDGVYRDAMIYVNDSLAGQHAFGYSRFVVRIDPYLRFGAENEIRVECRAHLDSRWYAGAGIHRDVHLIQKPAVHIAIDGVRVITPAIENDLAVVEVAVNVQNSGTFTSTLRLNAAIVDGDGVAVAKGSSPVTLLPSQAGIVRQRLCVTDPTLWSVEVPSLYSVRLELIDGEYISDVEDVTFGIRSLQLDPRKGLRLNGEEVKLRGACIHSDNGPIGAASIARAEERRIQTLKDAGFNAIRSAHNPMSSSLLDACDRIGMLVIDETFDVWTSGKSDFDYAFDFPEWWERDVEALVAKDFNHPCVIFYSIGNEIPETGDPIGATWGRRLAEKVRSLDPTRFVTNGINGFVSILSFLPDMRQQGENTSAEGGVNGLMDGFGETMDRIQSSELVTTHTEESFGTLDVAGMNYGEGRYELDRELFPNRVIVGSETWPKRIDRNWALVRNNSHVIGDFTWTGWDYLGETGIGVVQYSDRSRAGSAFATEYPGLTAWCGDIDITGQRRPISYYRETVFGLRRSPYIVVHRPENHGKRVAMATLWSWSDAIASWTWEGFEGKPITVEVYSNSDEVELLIDGAAAARASVGQARAFRADFELEYQPGELCAVAYTDGVETGRSSLRTAADDLCLIAETDRRELRADTGDLAFVSLVLTDGRGIVHTGRDRQVSVSLSGPATLQGLASANPVTEEGFTSPIHQTFDGKALAVVRPEAPGEITVTAETEGCPTTSVMLQAR
jgi:beta-galactosidase